MWFLPGIGSSGTHRSCPHLWLPCGLGSMTAIVFPTVNTRGQNGPICRVSEKGAQMLLCLHRPSVTSQLWGWLLFLPEVPGQTSAWRTYFQANIFSVYPGDSFVIP